MNCLEQCEVKNKIFFLKLILTTIIYSFVFFASLSSSSYAGEPRISVVAKVNNHIITNIDLLDRYQFALAASEITANSEQEKSSLLNQILQKMIDEELRIYAAQDLEITLTQTELDKAVEDVVARQDKTLEQFKKFFSNNNLSYKNYLRQLQSQLLWIKIINRIIAPKIKITDVEIKELLELKKIKTDILKLSIAEIYLPFDYEIDNKNLDTKLLASKLADEIRKGKNFKKIVEQFSRSPTAEFGGEIGWVGQGDIDAQIYNLISKIKIGEITDPIARSDGYHIFKLVDKKNISNLSDDDIKEVKNIIFNKKIQTAAKSYLMELHKKSFIEIY